MPTERFTFRGHGGHDLAARLDLPDGERRATALFAHCFTCGKDIAAARRISARLASDGIAVLRFDFTGLGHSGGEFANTTFSSNVDDLVRAAEHLAEEGHPPTLLIGHSLGGAAVLRARSRIPSIKAVATIGAPFDPGHVTHNFGDALDTIRRDGAGDVMLGGRKLRIGQGFVDDVADAKLHAAIRDLGAALLVLHAPRDETVGLENATNIFLAAKHPKSFVTLDSADHLVSRAEDADYAAEVIGAWVGRYLDLGRPAPPIGAPEGVTRVAEAEVEPDGFAQDIVTGGKHHLKADEPRAYGGTDSGPSPYQLLAAGLGACTSMTIRMYARRKKWPLTHVSVDVTHDRMHAQDAESASERIDRFRREVTLDGPLDDAQLARLLEIANRCPVHRTLESGAVVETVLREAPAVAAE